MPKYTKKNSRHFKKGGDIIGTFPIRQPSTLETWFNGAKKAASSAISSASLAASSAANSASLAASSAANSAKSAFNPTPTPTMTPLRTFGGSKKRRRGGSTRQFSLTDLASTASPISGILSAKPQVLVGGKTRKRSKSYKKKSNRKKRAKTMKFPFSNSLKRLIKM